MHIFKCSSKACLGVCLAVCIQESMSTTFQQIGLICRRLFFTLDPSSNYNMRSEFVHELASASKLMSQISNINFFVSKRKYTWLIDFCTLLLLFSFEWCMCMYASVKIILYNIGIDHYRWALMNTSWIVGCVYILYGEPCGDSEAQCGIL